MAHRLGLGRLLPNEICDHALAALSYQHALAERAVQSRWVTAALALAHGSPIQEVAAAMGMKVEELRGEFRRWMDGQLRDGFLTLAKHNELLQLVAPSSGPEHSGSGDHAPGKSYAAVHESRNNA